MYELIKGCAVLLMFVWIYQRFIIASFPTLLVTFRATMHFLLFLSFITVTVIASAAAQDLFVEDGPEEYDGFLVNDDSFRLTDSSSFPTFEGVEDEYYSLESQALSFSPTLESIEDEYYSSEPQALSSSCLTETPDWELGAWAKVRGRRDILGNANLCPPSSSSVVPFREDEIPDLDELRDKFTNIYPGRKTRTGEALRYAPLFEDI
jgi:hypothetical protein